MVDITIERTGGLAGIGLAGSHLKSIGRLALSDLSADDQKAVDAIFTAKRKVRQPKGAADMFNYTLSRNAADRVETVAVEEDQIPQPLLRCIHDILD